MAHRGPEKNNLLQKLREGRTTLVDYVSPLPICMGVKSGLTDAFAINETTKDSILKSDPKASEIIKPLLNGRDIRRYLIESNQKYLIYTYHNIDIQQYPAVREYLRPYRERLNARATRQAWYELQQPQYAFSKYMDLPKIIFPDIATTPRFALDTVGHYGSNTTYFIPTVDLYLLGLLNSKVGYFFFVQVCAALEGTGEAYLRFFGQYLEGFPVPVADKARHDQMVTLVEQMLSLHQQRASASEAAGHVLQALIDSTDRDIDALVYELYGLTEAEIALVEGR